MRRLMPHTACTPPQNARGPRGETLELRAEVRNRDHRAARYVALRALHAPQLELTLDPAAGEVPAGGRLAVTVSIRCERVGRHGIYGLSLEVRGSPGLYEVPLTFSNPFGIEVMPRVYATRARPALGGRSRIRADAGHIGPRMGGDYDLREIRDYQSGDPYKRIAWKASGRRGSLMVREFDLEERDVVWLLLDASAELWFGVYGEAPLDHAIDELATRAEFHLQRGDRVGLGVLAARRLFWSSPGAGSPQAARILEALAFRTSCYDSDRSGYDESEVASRVLEHLRPLAPELVENLRSRSIDRIAKRASIALPRAPFRAEPPYAPTPREQTLRHYLADFGIDSPARLEPDRPKTDAVLAEALNEVLTSRPRPSLVTIWSPAPDDSRQALRERLARLPRRHVQLRWVPTALASGFEAGRSELAEVVRYAVHTRSAAAHEGGIDALRRLGIRVESPRRRLRPARPAADWASASSETIEPPDSGPDASGTSSQANVRGAL